MKNSYKVVDKNQRKKILLLCDDIRMSSGVSNMAREIVFNSVQHFNWATIGAMLKHPEEGKLLDLSKSAAEKTGVEDAYVRLYASTGYGTPTFLRRVIENENPDALFLFTDPRYWVWLFNMEKEIRSEIPIFYLNIWDNYPAPLYNKPYYESCDLLMAISKQTKNINEIVLGDKAEEKIIEYVPHGVDEEVFYPLENTADVDTFKSATFDKDVEFVALYNSRNIRRKQTSDILLGFKLFCDSIGLEKSKKCALVLHTDPKDQAGTDLIRTKNDLLGSDNYNVYFSTNKLSTKQLNLLYNAADVNILISSAEGWGLSVTESMMAGTMSIVNVTGGIQDQCRFEDENGNWINFSPSFPSNHLKTYTKHGEWVEPIFPSTTTLVGSIATPYIYEDRVSIPDIAKALEKVYSLDKKERNRRGKRGREWAMSEEAGFTSTTMTNRIIDACNKGFQNFKPRERFELIQINDSTEEVINHKMFNYE